MAGAVVVSSFNLVSLLHCSWLRIEDSQQKGLAGPEGVGRRTPLPTIAEANSPLAADRHWRP
jgi:hypothetical protein